MISKKQFFITFAVKIKNSHYMQKHYLATSFLTAFLSVITFVAVAQNEFQDSEKGFKKNRLFTGGNFTAGFGSGYTAAGLSPIFGYEFSDFFDGGIVVNFLYQSQRDYYTSDKARQTTFGPGVFVRAYPLPSLFLQAQFEQNFIRSKGYSNGTWTQYHPENDDPTYHPNPQSLLLGAGYAGGRTKGGTSFYYLSLLFDVLKQNGSPYVDRDLNGNLTLRPIINAGFNIGLFQKRYKN
jgi:hypothetical protein